MRYEQPYDNQNLTNYNTRAFSQMISKSKITVCLLVIMLFMFMVQIIYQWASQHLFNIITIKSTSLIQLGGNVPYRVSSGEVYRLIIPIFLHAGFVHIFMNGFTMIAFITFIEQSISKSLFLFTFFVGGIHGNMLSCMISLCLYGANPFIVSIGASTSICAGIGIWLATLASDSTRLRSNAILIALIIGYIVITSLLPGVDAAGHFGSLISGALIGLSVFPKNKIVHRIARGLFIIYTIGLFAIFLI